MDNVARPTDLSMTTEIVVAYIKNNTVAPQELPSLILSIYGALRTANSHPASETKPIPAVPVKRSVTEEYLVCLEDGRKMTMLRRYIRTQYNMSPDEYRKKWNLPAEYPMVAPSYSKTKSAIAKKIGLGRKKAE